MGARVLLTLLGLIALASAARLDPARRRLLQETAHNHSHGDHSHDDHGHDHGVDMKPLELNLTEVHGVWHGLSDQIPASIANMQGAAGFPNCSADASSFSYTHYSPSDPHYQSIATWGNTTAMSGYGHMRATSKLVKAYQAGVLEVEDATGKADCMQWKPYVDLRSGELKATYLRTRVYKQDPNGTVVYEAANCNLTGDEKPGCTEAGNRGDGTFTVTAVMRATYVCKAGNCLKFSPLFHPEDGHAH